MKQKLPREFLWTDKKSMDEFFRLSPVNEDFFEVFQSLRNVPFNVAVDAVKVFNEVYYQVTRMRYEMPLFNEMPNYVADIKANIGWNYSAELVMTMAYFLIDLSELRGKKLDIMFAHEIVGDFAYCFYWEPFETLAKKLKKEGRKLNYGFTPRPVHPLRLLEKYIPWSDVTCNYSPSIIDSVLRLWKNKENRQIVDKMINDSRQTKSFISSKFDFDNVCAELRERLSPWLAAEDCGWFYDSEPTEEEQRLQEQVCLMEKEKVAMQKRIDELEGENKRLHTLLESKKKPMVGEDRLFTLPQIVDYCKARVNWDEADPIVKMLNNFLRSGSTKEDCKLVDGIEEHFKQRMGWGIMVEQASIGVNSPGNIISRTCNL